MIIEGAFYKLPEVMFANLNQGNERIQESTLVNFFTNSIMLEFNSRNIENPMKRVIVGKQFPKNKTGNKRAIADIYLDLTGLYDNNLSNHFAIFPWNYIEVKCYTKKPLQNESTEATTTNTAIIINDLLRLHKYAGFNFGKCFLIVFDDKKNYYLAYKNRDYLNSLFTPGIHDIEIPLKDEVKTFKESVDHNLIEDLIKLKIYVYEWISFINQKHSGYLIKILRGS